MVILAGIDPLLRRFLEEIVSYTRKHSQNVPKREGRTWHVERETGNRVLNQRISASLDYSLFLGNRSKEIDEMDSFSQLKQATKADAKLTRALLGTEGTGDVDWFLLFRYLIPIAERLLRALDEGKKFETEASQLLNLFDGFLSKDTFTVRLYAPLLNFKSVSEGIDLADGISLGALPDHVLEKYLSILVPIMGYSKPHELLGLEFQLEATAEFTRVNPYLPFRDVSFQASCLTLLRAFRLYRSGATGIAFIGGDSETGLGFGGSWMAFPKLEPLFGNLYEFSAADAPAVAALYTRLTQVREHQRFDLAIRRFMASYEKPLEGDRLIDYWIALESLLVPDSTTELKYRVSLRTAALIEEPAKRKEVFDGVRASYDARSKFIHGDPAKVDAVIVSATEEYLRKVLLRSLDLGGPPSREFLDSLILGATATNKQD